MKALAIGTFFAAAFAFMGTEDAREQERQIAEYCQAVKVGQWPAYKGMEDCK